MDLGAQMAYQGVPHLGKYKKRFEKSHDRLLRLQHIPFPLKTKIQFVKGSIYPCAFYGVEVLPLGESHTKKLKSAICTALIGEAHSSNPALAILAIPDLLYPLLELVHRVIRASARLLGRLTPDDKSCSIAWHPFIQACHTSAKDQRHVWPTTFRKWDGNLGQMATYKLMPSLVCTC